MPIGAITWGAGSIGQESISALAKDFRNLITKDDSWKINPEDYTIEDVANKFKKFIFDGHYDIVFKDWTEKPVLGFMIVGFSSGQPLAEEWMMNIENGECKGPFLVRGQSQIGMTWNGQPEAISRLFFGVGGGLRVVLNDEGLDDVTIERILNSCQNKLIVQLVMAAMPIQDTIDLAIFLADATINFSKFSPGAQVVGGPIEVAAITQHEGFKWVQRKHYYDKSLNPMEE